ncbi:hypothetical protein [Spirosoma validum]|uniref:Uncharacterized protein n=1 Tax=Spirosoma validum TaxID=2771355 RepID=A0A927B7Z2_9BACT|nr:hypothetical protein [Spirosoma validum]MBD2757399.1 hypothetical protein [Spirosoma validum]
MLKLLNGLQPPDTLPRLNGKTPRMNQFLTLYRLLNIILLSVSQPDQDDQTDYTTYHQTIAKAQQLIAHKHYQEALSLYNQVVDRYEFVFSRDYKVATQLALQVGQKQQAFTYLKKAIATGWTMSDIKKNALLTPLQGDPQWRVVEQQYDSLRARYQTGGNQAIRARVEKMFKKDQRKALLALFRMGATQEQYAEKRFAPHNEQQMGQLLPIIDQYGYPGERLIHNSYWAAVMLSHHNSISKAYTLKDTVYPHVRPKLMKALKSGQLSPYEFAMIDDWYMAVKTNGQQTHFGYLSSSLTAQAKANVDQRRAAIGLSSVETISLLTDLHQQTGFNCYLPSNLVKKIAPAE